MVTDEDRKAAMPERDNLALAMLAAWLNVRVDQIPPENVAHTNPHTMEAWSRVGEVARIAAFHAGLDRGAARVEELLGCTNHISDAIRALKENNDG